MTDRKHTILVVDDDADARLVMRAALRKAGYDVRLADGGHEALRLFRDEPSDMVMLDVDMPDMSGVEVCAALRAEAGPLLPIVMVTGMDDVRSVEVAYESGATDFIAKPVNWAMIGHRVRYLFRGRQALLDLQTAEARMAAILNAIPDLLFELDIDGRYIEFRAPDPELLAAPGESLIGRRVQDVLPGPAAEICMSALRIALAHGVSNGAQFELPLPKGKSWFELSVTRKAMPAGEKPHFIVLSRDISERKLAESQITRLAYVDSLTGLPNRRSFLERVDHEIQHAALNRSRLAVLFMDLDGFKDINDTMGHAAGDLILQTAADRLRDGLRPNDLLSRPVGLDADQPMSVELARLGGDEFTALIQAIECPEDAIAIAQRIGQLMRRPFVLAGRKVTLTTSIGIALYPDDSPDAATLLKHADTAMYHAKRSGRDNAQVYDSSLTDEIVQRLELNASLQAALERREFHLVYQPQIDVKTGQISSVEALIRWVHPTRGTISPLEFIPVAEECGLIEDIGHWVLQTACSEALSWQCGGAPVRVAVNLSPLQFANPDLPGLVSLVLARTGLAPDLLELEVTEGVLMADTAASGAALRSIRSLGVHVALDDFGTGYSSLAYLSRMPIDNIKVDRSFVARLLEGGENAAIVRAVLAMSHSLGMRVTAEGVETLAQARALQSMNCDLLQGFYFSRPVASHDVPALLSRCRWLDVATTTDEPAARNKQPQDAAQGVGQALLMTRASSRSS